jgi:hypothetical protein
MDGQSSSDQNRAHRKAHRERNLVPWLPTKRASTAASLGMMRSNHAYRAMGEG